MPKLDCLYHVCDRVQVEIARRYVNGELRSPESISCPMYWARELSANLRKLNLQLSAADLKLLHLSCPEYYIRGILTGDPDFQKKAHIGIAGLLRVAQQRGAIDEKSRIRLTAHYLSRIGKPAIIQALMLDAEPSPNSRVYPGPEEFWTHCVIRDYLAFLL